jgi:NAD-dependent deacetylase
MTDLARLVAEAERIVFFTGAGISTESGIPDFRSPTGLWQKLKPIMFQDFLASEEARIEAWRRKFEIDATIAKASPNCGHQVIAAMVAMDRVEHVITQNIDNLHQVSGIPEDKIIELHGNGTYAKCLSCETRYALEEIKARFQASDECVAPRCTACNGVIKSATISFGQAMPEHEMRRAEIATLSCDLFIVVGSSLQVFPAAGFPLIAKKNGARLVIINREATDFDSIADLVIHDEIGPCLSALLQNKA